MTVEHGIASFLRTNAKQPYCDDCLRELLNLGTAGNRHMAQNPQNRSLPEGCEGLDRKPVLL